MNRSDLRVFTDEELANPSPIEAYTDLVKLTRPVLISDLVEVLKKEDGWPDYEAAAKVYAEHRPGVGPVTDRKRVQAIVDAALHPGEDK